MKLSILMSPLLYYYMLLLMKISEMINNLESILQANWDLEVVVQYRDSWWEYYWQDDYCTPNVIEWKVIL